MTFSGDAATSRAYKAYLIETKKGSYERIIHNSIKELLSLVDSIEVYTALAPFTKANDTKEIASSGLRDDILVGLAQYKITAEWLLNHDLLSEKDLPGEKMPSYVYEFTYKKVKGGIRIDSVKASGGIRIPDFIEGEPVVKVASTAFAKRKDITSVVLPRYLLEIEDHAFAGSGIVSIVIPDSVETIGGYAFENCRHLESLILPQSLKSIKYRTFAGCSSLTTLKIPAGVTYIDDWAFDRCKNLKDIQVPDSVKRIGYCVFPPKATLYCNIGSRAYRYTNEHQNITAKPFEELEQG